ncbi:hypothetical protein FH972_022513 [Carpinus fangiana]|uniref:AMP-dependent synthetase/ligase domain-containing protein n=1 Tax=Carpinus fangiana TaxID=176857 RepID=A0A5N6KT47_9ROSI|nr:hypothetical protein FH972_022513 [Carpinus fangiana]
MYEYRSDRSEVEVPYSDVLSFVLDGPHAEAHARKKESLVPADRSELSSPACAIGTDSLQKYLYPVLFLAIVGSGATFLGLNPSCTTGETDHAIKVANVKFILVQPPCFEAMASMAAQSGIPSDHVLVFDGELSDHEEETSNLHTWGKLLSHGEQDWIRFDDEESAGTTPAALFLTSGTTGMPKAAVHTHYALVTKYLVTQDRPKPYEVRRLITVPMFHAFAAVLVHIAPSVEGCTTYIAPRFKLDSCIGFAKRYGITEWPMVPQIISRLVDSIQSQAEHSDTLKSIRLVSCGGAPLPLELKRNLEKLLHSEARVAEQWGMSEVGTITNFPYPETDDSGSVGTIFPNTRIRLRDAEGQYISQDECPGEIIVHTPSRMLGYLGDPTSTNVVLSPDGWYTTGDIGYCRKGKWYIVDRAKDIIKVRGWQVAPAELEACLLGHPQVKDAAVIGVRRQGDVSELPRAYVVHDGSGVISLSEKDVATFLQDRLAGYKSLDGGVKFVETIPRNTSGKILRRVLREMAEQEGFNTKIA